MIVLREIDFLSILVSFSPTMLKFELIFTNNLKLHFNKKKKCSIFLKLHDFFNNLVFLNGNYAVDYVRCYNFLSFIVINI